MAKSLRLFGLSASAVLVGVFSSLTVATATSSRAAIAGNVPSWATSANWKGSANGSDNIGFRVYLNWRNASAATALATAVSNPKSSRYGKYLTAAQFRQQFSPSQATVNSVQSWLRSQGFTVDYTPLNNHYVQAEGTVAQASAAFGTSFGLYSVRGMTLRAPNSNVTMPANLASSVRGIIGLDESAALVRPDIARDPKASPPGAFVNAPPCSTYWAQQVDTTQTNPYGANPLPYAPCGYTPSQIRGAYGLPAGADGAGATVAIIDAYASPTIFSDANQWSANRGVPALTHSQFTQVVAPGTFRRPQNPRQDPQGWSGEETLDVEAVHGVAPAANIVYVGAPNNYQDLDAAMNHVVDMHMAQIVTNSYGFLAEELPFGFIKPEEDTFIQGAIEGIGIYFSSGDNNDELNVIGFTTPDWPASSPWVTAVGGTSLAVGAANNYLFETGWGTTRARWNTNCDTNAPATWCPDPNTPNANGDLGGMWLYGAGGGVSCLFARPSYQSGVVPSGLEANSQSACPGSTGRAVPDVSMVGDPNTGYLIGQTQAFPDGNRYSEYRIGGTSLSSPLFAAVMADVDAASGTVHGFANPALYAAGSYTDVTDPASTQAVVRVDYRNGIDAADGTLISLRTMNQTVTLDTTAGYDDVTGMGSPNAAWFAAMTS